MGYVSLLIFYFIIDLFCLQGGDLSLIYTIGCVEMFLSLAETELPIVGGIVIGFAVPLVSTSLTGQQSGIGHLCITI